MILYIIVYWFFLFEAQKSHFIQKISIWKYGFLNFSGALGVPLWKQISKNGSKPSTITRIKKSLTFGPQKITLKLIYRCFPLGGAEKASNRVKRHLPDLWYLQKGAFCWLGVVEDLIIYSLHELQIHRCAL